MKRLLLCLLTVLASAPAGAMLYDVTRVKVKGLPINVVRMSGLIENGEMGGWQWAVSRLDPSLNTLFILNSPGGTVPGGFMLLTLIEEFLRSQAQAGRTASVLVTKECSSMCVPVYFMFGRRLALPSARFGLHGVSLGLIGFDPEQTQLYLGRMRSKAAERGQDGFARWIAQKSSEGVFSTTELTRINASELASQGSGLVETAGLVDDEAAALERVGAAGAP
ncbi:MAG: hypothetical protein HY077_07735 [Elusimicrobia bacterium]|nr:hypothetical protein [Elusimicrobiota bacterium]